MKPPYVVPSMADVRATPKTGLVAASLFSGCGGSSLGYRMAGFDVRYASEFVPAARETYEANAPSTFVDPRDVREVTGDDVLRHLKMTSGELDLLDGSPPCASFSRSGKREAGWGQVSRYSDTAQRTDDLFFEYVRLLRELRPRVFVAENVPGLVTGTAKGYFRAIFRELRDSGYVVEARVVNAAQLGVPTARRRLIFVGVRADLAMRPAYPSPLPYVFTVRDALSTVDHPPIIERDPETGFDLTFLARSAHGRDWARLRAGKQPRYLSSLAHPNKPCPTITASVKAAGVVHASQCRKFSLAELRAVCSFPSDFVLTGSFEQRWERLGRAVPPLMMRAIASTLRDVVLQPAQTAASA